MSLRAGANYSILGITNTGREAAVPPMVFPDLSTDPSQNFSFCIWVRETTKIPTPVIQYYGINGSYINIGSDGFLWSINGRTGTVGLPSLPLGHVSYGLWTLFCLTKNGSTVTIYFGEEAPIEFNPWEAPVDIRMVMQVDYPMVDPFNAIHISLSNNADICNFKFWKGVLTIEQLKAQANTWVPDGVPAPMWVSPLRVAGDISNVANPSSTINWSAEHGFSSIGSLQNIKTGGSLGAWNDPAYLAYTQPCITWVYPVNFPTELGYCFVNPGTTPVSATIYKAPQFFSFADKGSIPHEDDSIQKIEQYATIFSNPAEGKVADDSFGLYKDETGVERSPDFANPANRFEQDSGVTLYQSGASTIPGALITATNMYLWKFGGQFRWQPAAPPTATAQSGLLHQFLYVTYIGFPTGLLLLSETDLSGLFIMNTNLPRTDKYQGFTSLKIPDPTIRTALIGE
jgi:hypothetical protein